jgi:hypothetical protein
VQRSFVVAKRGVAVLVRTVFIESIGRYRKENSANNLRPVH